MCIAFPDLMPGKRNGAKIAIFFGVMCFWRTKVSNFFRNFTPMNRITQWLLAKSDTLPRPVGKVLRFYVEGFSEMTVGRKLWAVILVKLFIMFFIFKLFLFPDVLKRDYDNDQDRAQAVRTTLTGRD